MPKTETRDVAADVEELLARLSLLRVAKDLFLSEWFLTTCETLFDGEDLETLLRISEESGRERERVLAVMREWTARDTDRSGERMAQVARFSRSDFLRSLTAGKDEAGAALEKVATLAPPDLREELLRLAAVDFRHATELRQLLLKQFPAPELD